MFQMNVLIKLLSPPVSDSVLHVDTAFQFAVLSTKLQLSSLDLFHYTTPVLLHAGAVRRLLPKSLRQES